MKNSFKMLTTIVLGLSLFMGAAAQSGEIENQMPQILYKWFLFKEFGNTMNVPIELTEIIKSNLYEASYPDAVRQYLGEMVFIPAVTQEDVDYLYESGVETSIQAPMRAFKTPRAAVSIGLWKAVMGKYPDLSMSIWPTLSEMKKAETQDQWDQNPDLPAVYINVSDQEAFTEKLTKMTGRKFYIPQATDQVEVMIRGRDTEGKITTTRFYFGDDKNEVNNHAWIAVNSARHAHGVHETLQGKEKEFQNSYGLINPIGNVWIRSADGFMRGGAFLTGPWGAKSSNFVGEYAKDCLHNVGFRIIEAVKN